MTRSKPYNGHKNWNYWNVALWLGNDYGLYCLAKDCINTTRTLEQATDLFLDYIANSGLEKTPDGAPYSKSAVRAALSGLKG